MFSYLPNYASSTLLSVICATLLDSCLFFVSFIFTMVSHLSRLCCIYHDCVAFITIVFSIMLLLFLSFAIHMVMIRPCLVYILAINHSINITGYLSRDQHFRSLIPRSTLLLFLRTTLMADWSLDQYHWPLIPRSTLLLFPRTTPKRAQLIFHN